jgi:hypothetical protein
MSKDSSSNSDFEHHVIIRKLLDFTFDVSGGPSSVRLPSQVMTHIQTGLR